MKARERMGIQDLESRLGRVREYLATKPVLRAWLFGSYSRGEATRHSDVDILVQYDFSQSVSLITIGGMIGDLAELLGRRVDLVGDGGLMPFARPTVNRDRILIYEREGEG